MFQSGQINAKTFLHAPFYLNYIIPYLHAVSFVAAKQAMEQGKSPVIIDNTNTQAWEMKPYVEVVGFTVKLYHLLQLCEFTFICSELVCCVQKHLPIFLSWASEGRLLVDTMSKWYGDSLEQF